MSNNTLYACIDAVALSAMVSIVFCSASVPLIGKGGFYVSFLPFSRLSHLCSASFCLWVGPSTRFHSKLETASIDHSLKPHAQLGPWNTGYFGFGGGVPVGGWAQLTLWDNGAYQFAGHFHDTGFPSYNAGLVWGVVSRSGVLYTFSQQVHLAGTVEPGSRDGDWNISGVNPAIQAGWNDLYAQWRWSWRARVNMDLGGIINLVKDAISTVSTITSVIAIVA